MSDTQTLEPAIAATPQPFTHLIEDGESRRRWALVKTWCGIYIRNGDGHEIAPHTRPTCPVCRQLQDDLDEMEF